MRIVRIDLTPASLIATIISAFAFASFHYLGPGKEDIDLYSFLFRLLAGLVFGIFYVFRGFGIAAYTHTFYDLYLDLYFAAS
jgi:membrane protease YdiL (CAAX protease family)